MTFVGCYLKEHRGVIFLELFFVGIFAAIFSLYHLPLAAVLYPAFLCLLAGCMYMGGQIYKAYVKHQKLMALSSLHKAAVWELLEDGFSGKRNTLEKDYGQIIENLCREMQSMEDGTAASYREMIDYFTLWVHQIKTPIASMQLHLSGEDSRLSRRLSSDVLHIEQYVEMVLTYLRMGDGTSDYVFRPVNLDEVIRENIRKHRGDFIMKKLALIYEPVNETVVSDEKWLSFVIGQLLSNALKYTDEGSVTISMEKKGILSISDTGIGIAPEDIPRIFERGYTGGNGRGDKRATGIGLYLCKQICDRIGAKIRVYSQVEQGTKVEIEFGGTY